MKIVKNYLYNVGYQLFVIIIPLITIPYISRVLGSTGVGINAYTNSIIQYFVLIGSIGINLYGNRTIAYYRDDKQKLSQLFWEIAILRIIFISASYLLFLIFIGFVTKFKEYYFYQSFLLVAAAFDISWFFMGLEDFKKTVLRNIIIKLISLVAIFSLVKNANDTGLYILILSLSVFVGNLTLWTYLVRIVESPKFNEINIVRHIKPSLELFIPQVATQIYLVLNKTMLGSMSGVKSAGYYENSDKIVKVILAVVTATGTVMLPRMANTFAQGNLNKVHQYLYRSLDFVSAICFPMAFGLAAIAPKFSIWFLGKEFEITGTIIPILSVVIIFIGWSNVLGTQFLLPTNQTKYFTISVIGGALVNLVLNIPLIWSYGVIGASISTIASEFTVTSIQLYFASKGLSVEKLFSHKWKYIVSALMMFIAVRVMNSLFSMNVFFLGVQVFVGCIVYTTLLFILKAPILTQIKELIGSEQNGRR